LAERFDAITGRLEGVPRLLEEARNRSDRPQVPLWQRIALEAGGPVPDPVDEFVAAGRGVLGPAEGRRLDRAVAAANVAVDLYTTRLDGTNAHGTHASAPGRER